TAVSLAITVRSRFCCRTISSITRSGVPTPMKPPIIRLAPSGISATASESAMVCMAAPRGLIDDVVAAVDVHRLAGDQLGDVERQEGGGGADVVDADQAARGRGLLRLVQEVVELRDAGGRAGRQRSGRDRMHADALGPELGCDVAHRAFERRL